MRAFKQKSLGKLESRLLAALQTKGKKVFTLKQALAITKTSYDATRLLIGNLVNKGWLIRIKKGNYLILSLQEEAQVLQNWYPVAAALVGTSPYYISHYTALALHNMTTQPILMVCVSTSKRVPDRIVSKIKFNFIFCPVKKLWGTEEKWINKQEKVQVSDPERTIIDALSRLDLCGGLSEVAKAVWLKRQELDYNKLLGYANRFAIKAVSRRLGFILELYGLGNHKILNKLKKRGKSFSLLDPTLAKKGHYSKDWMLLINSDPQELKRIIWT